MTLNTTAMPKGMVAQISAFDMDLDSIALSNVHHKMDNNMESSFSFTCSSFSYFLVSRSDYEV